jgi:hypothetical protein
MVRATLTSASARLAATQQAPCSELQVGSKAEMNSRNLFLLSKLPYTTHICCQIQYIEV